MTGMSAPSTPIDAMRDGRDHHVDAERPEGAATAADQAVGLGGVVRGENRRELAPEAGEAGQAERRHGGEPEDPAEMRGLGEQAAETAELPCLVALLHR